MSAVVEWCRACRDKDSLTQAEFIIWGKYFPPEHLGPRCYDHTADAVRNNMSQVDQYAIFDLRGLSRD